MRAALEGAAVLVAPSMNAQGVANALWALATLGWQAADGAMRAALEGAAVRVAPSMNAQDVANALWALATLGWRANAEMAVVCVQLIEGLVHDCGRSQLSPMHLSQLLQAHLASQFLGFGLVTLPPAMLEVAVKAHREEALKVTVLCRIVSERLDTPCAAWAYHMSSSTSRPMGCSA